MRHLRRLVVRALTASGLSVADYRPHHREISDGGCDVWRLQITVGWHTACG